MSLPILVAMVVIGITVAVAAVHLTGGSLRASFSGPQQARQRFAIDFPDHAVTAVYLTEDRRTAFLEVSGDRLGVVHGLGDKFLTRLLMPGDAVRASSPEPTTVAVQFNDFTWKGGTFRFVDADTAGAVLALVSGMPAALWRKSA